MNKEYEHITSHWSLNEYHRELFSWYYFEVCELICRPVVALLWYSSLILAVMLKQ